MKSPIHPHIDLEEYELEPGLNVWRCPSSLGYWMPSPSYWHWHSQQDADALKKISQTPHPHHAPIPQNGDRKALLCPESHCILLRYRVSGELGFYVDRSPATGGIWLDAGEWEALKDHGMHATLHMIFSNSYQRRVMLEEAENALDEQFFGELSTQDRECVQEMLTWLKPHPLNRRILAWLQHHTLK